MVAMQKTSHDHLVERAVAGRSFAGDRNLKRSIQVFNI